MSQNEQTYWKIHDYLKEKMVGEDLLDFQKEIEDNPALKEEIEIHRIANKLIINNRLTIAKQTSLTIQKTEKKRIFYTKLLIGIALTASILSGMYLIFRTASEQQKVSIKTSKQTIPVSGMRNNQASIQSKEAIRDLPIDIIQSKKGIAEQNIPQIEIAEEDKHVETENQPAITEKSIVLQNPISYVQEERKIETKIEAKSEAKEIENLCSKTAITAFISASTTCGNRNEGNISVSGFKGGKSPYKFEIVSEKSNKIVKNNQLSAGKYSVFISDGNQCMTTIENVQVKEVSCDNIEEVFNPFLGEMLSLPGYHSIGTFNVHEKNGAIFFKKDLLADERVEWNGISQNGEMETGHFVYELIYEDGTRKYGSITITR